MCGQLERDINEFCSDELLKQVLEELRDSKGIINCTHLKPENGDGKTDGNLAKDATVVVGSGAVAGVAVPAAFTGIGFTANGIASGSIAALIQSMIGSVPAGSLFSLIQSYGALGGFAMFGPAAIIAAATTGGSVLTYKVAQKIYREMKKKEKMQQQKLEKSKEIQSKIVNGTVEKDTDVCQKCWIKMKLLRTN